MSVNYLLILCLFMLIWNQCSCHLVLENNIQSEDESEVEELKVAKQIDTENELTSLEFTMFGKPYSFKLTQSNSIFSPDFQILTDMIQDNDKKYDDDYLISQETEALNGAFYTDENGIGSFYIEQDKNGQIKMDGFVDDHVIIRHFEGRHKATKTLQQKSKFDREPIKGKFYPKFEHISLQDKHDLAIIETLLFIDHIVYQKLEHEKASIKKYVGIYWNAVQNKYKLFSQPKIKFTITGVMPLKDMQWEHDTFLAPNKVEDEKFLQRFGEWLYSKRGKFPKYDVAVMHTGFDLSYLDNGEVNTGTLGIAPLRGICTVDDEDESVISSGVMEDPYAPTYAGAMTAAHEIGHLLGASHDNPKRCDKHGLMAPYDEEISPSTMVFCNFSIHEIKKTLNSKVASCLYKSNDQAKIPIGPDVPVMSRSEICKMAYGDDFADLPLNIYKRTDPCVYVLCMKNKTLKGIKALMWVPERTECGNGKVCLKGKCG